MRINAERRASSIVISCCLSQKRCYSLFKLRAYSILSDKPLPLFMKVDGGVSWKQFWDEGDRIIETLSEVRDLTQIAKGTWRRVLVQKRSRVTMQRRLLQDS